MTFALLILAAVLLAAAAIAVRCWLWFSALDRHSDIHGDD